MAKVSPIQESFSGGEYSPLLAGRVGLERYGQGMDTCFNMLPLLQGPVQRRPGTRFVAEVKDSSRFTRLVEFEFSITQAYVLEFGHNYIRVYKDYGQVVVAGPAAYEVVTTYTEAELPDLRFVQSTDTLYICHPDHTPATLTRTAHDNWTLGTPGFPWGIRGPFLDVNDASNGTTLTPAATTGTNVVVTASAIAGINDGTGFQTTDVGRWLMIKNNAIWGAAKIVSRTSTTVVNVMIYNSWGNTTASTDWRLGAWTSVLGYPKCVTFHEDRLVFGGTRSFPQRFDGSATGDYLDFIPYDYPTNSVVSSGPYSFSLNSEDINNIRWIKSDEKGMPIGTVAGEWVVRPSSSGDAITPTNVSAKKLSNYGSADIPAIQLGKAVIFAQRTKRKLRELTYFYEVDGFKAQDMTELALHIGESGFKEMKGQKEPQPIVWACREDGLLTSMTYSREEGLLAGWARHQIGGVSDSNGTNAIVESLAVIPSPDTSCYDVWMIVKRYIDGGVKRYIEYMTRPFDEEDAQEDAYFLDSGLTYYDPKTLIGITVDGGTGVVTVESTGHGFSNGDSVKFFEIMGMTELHNQTIEIENVSADEFDLVGIDGSLFNAYVSGGEVRKVVTVISGLDHLEGEVVSVFGDGEAQEDRTVSAGSITLSKGATKVHIGLNYISDGKLLRIDAGSQDGTSLGKTRRTHNVTFMVHRSLGFKFGMSFDALDSAVFPESSDPLNIPKPLYSGFILETIEADYDTENQICFRQDQPYPLTILAIMPQMATQDAR